MPLGNRIGRSDSGECQQESEEPGDENPETKHSVRQFYEADEVIGHFDQWQCIAELKVQIRFIATRFPITQE